MEDRVRAIFAELLGLNATEVTDNMSYNSLEKWDSLKHLELVSKLEDTFGINIDMDDVIAMSNFRKVVETAQKYLDKKS